MSVLTESPAWKALQTHRDAMQAIAAADLFKADAQRFSKFSLRLNGLLMDYSKQRVNADTLKLLVELARQQGVEQWRDRMFAGEKINNTEDRAVLHTALRNQDQKAVMFDGQDVMPAVRDVLTRMEKFCEDVRGGSWRGATGKAITDIVNIGIGGSDLGPRMVVGALRKPEDKIRAHFVANVDADELQKVFHACDPATTLFVIVSKTFTTQETMLNAQSARSWLRAKLGDKPEVVSKHMVAVSTNLEATKSFGVAPENVFGFWDWVGGRYSLWSAVGLSIALALGIDIFRALLKGAYEMDTHFRIAPLERNMPVMMALLGVWNRNFFNAAALAVLPYSQRLYDFPFYLQQLDMESNGKSVDRSGNPVNYQTAPVIFGFPGTVGQHSFYQLMHQGTDVIPADFIGIRDDAYGMPNHHRALLANFLAQPEALMRGRSAEELRRADVGDTLIPHRIAPGNRPSTVLLLDRLDAHTLGMLIALYEHKIFVQGIVWNINSFDQWGVELGKQLAGSILRDLGNTGELSPRDGSTNGLIGIIRQDAAQAKG